VPKGEDVGVVFEGEVLPADSDYLWPGQFVGVGFA
jgi:hypothetical protein